MNHRFHIYSKLFYVKSCSRQPKSTRLPFLKINAKINLSSRLCWLCCSWKNFLAVKQREGWLLLTQTTGNRVLITEAKENTATSERPWRVKASKYNLYLQRNLQVIALKTKSNGAKKNTQFIEILSSSRETEQRTMCQG